MKKLMLSMIGFWAFVGLSLMASMAMADQTNKISVPVAFGLGLNTAGAGAVNHAILPDKIDVKEGGVVHFLVAGFHQAVVFEPGTKLEDIVPDNGRVIDPTLPLPANVIYFGASPTGDASPLSNARNRVESVAFLDRGTYLVICNITGHFDDGMVASVKVKGGDDDDDDDDD